MIIVKGVKKVRCRLTGHETYRVVVWWTFLCFRMRATYHAGCELIPGNWVWLCDQTGNVVKKPRLIELLDRAVHKARLGYLVN